MVARPSLRTRVLLNLPTVLLALCALVVSVLQVLPRPGVSMPEAAPVSEQQRLYAAPGGKYSAADILTNGTAPAADRYRGLIADHHLHPALGERICPITHTRANPRFAWSIGGQRYLFCCPPCIDEFVKQAKANPASIQAPESYVQR